MLVWSSPESKAVIEFEPLPSEEKNPLVKKEGDDIVMQFQWGYPGEQPKLRELKLAFGQRVEEFNSGEHNFDCFCTALWCEDYDYLSQKTDISRFMKDEFSIVSAIRVMDMAGARMLCSTEVDQFLIRQIFDKGLGISSTDFLTDSFA